MAENKDEEEKMREAVRLAKKWKRIELPLAIATFFLAITTGLILEYAFQLSSTVCGIIAVAIYSICNTFSGCLTFTKDR